MVDDTQIRVLRTMRAMAWQRAKGELQALMQTYWSAVDGDEAYAKARKCVNAAIKPIEEEPGIC